MSSQPDPRHAARAIALQQLFDHAKHPAGPFFPAAELAEILETGYDAELANSLVKGVIAEQEKIDPIISQLAPAWPLTQIALVDLIILRIGIWEGFLSKLTPERVVINECVELAKEFGGENSPSFVNGVLGNLVTAEKQ